MLRISYGAVRELSASGEGILLSDYRREKLRFLRPERQRRQTIGAELLLIRALRDCGAKPELPLPLMKDENGKPYLPGGSLFFSLSHAGDYAACAISDYPVGLDIQTLSTFREPILRSGFTPDEQCYVLSAANKEAAFTEVWTRKESYMKMSGLGLRLPLQSFSSLAPPENCNIWHTETEYFHLAVCVSGISPIPEKIQEEKLP